MILGATSLAGDFFFFFESKPLVGKTTASQFIGDIFGKALYHQPARVVGQTGFGGFCLFSWRIVRG